MSKRTSDRIREGDRVVIEGSRVNGADHTVRGVAVFDQNEDGGFLLRTPSGAILFVRRYGDTVKVNRKKGTGQATVLRDGWIETVETTTDAELVAEEMGDDGLTYHLDDGRSLYDIVEDAGGEWQHSYGERGSRAHFPDNSVIIDAGSCWDIGYPDCWCMVGAGHHDGCDGLD